MMRKTRILLQGILSGVLLLAIVFLVATPKYSAHTGNEQTSVTVNAEIGDGKSERAEGDVTGTSPTYVFDDGVTAFSQGTVRPLSAQDTTAATENGSDESAASQGETNSANTFWRVLSIVFIALFAVTAVGMVYLLLYLKARRKAVQSAEVEPQCKEEAQAAVSQCGEQETRDTMPETGDGRVDHQDKLLHELYMVNTTMSHLACEASQFDQRLMEYLDSEFNRLLSAVSDRSQDNPSESNIEDKLVLLEGKVQELLETNSRLAGQVKKTTEKNARLEEQVKELTETNAQLEKKVEELEEEKERQKAPHLVGRPIEDYLPEIDEAFARADSYGYEDEDPEGSFSAQRQELNIIRKTLEIYRSQR